jgi:hypothetical protein
LHDALVALGQPKLRHHPKRKTVMFGVFLLFYPSRRLSGWSVAQYLVPACWLLSHTVVVVYLAESSSGNNKPLHICAIAVCHGHHHADKTDAVAHPHQGRQKPQGQQSCRFQVNVGSKRVNYYSCFFSGVCQIVKNHVLRPGDYIYLEAQQKCS